MTLRADDGTLLEAKEAIVVGTHGETLLEPQEAGYQGKKGNENAYFKAFSRGRVIKLNAGWSLLGILAIAAFLVVGGAFFSVFAVLGLGIWILRRLIRLFV